MSTLEEIEAAIPSLNAQELAALAQIVNAELERKEPTPKVEWPDFAARLDKLFPDGPPPGKTASEIMYEARGEY